MDVDGLSMTRGRLREGRGWKGVSRLSEGGGGLRRLGIKCKTPQGKTMKRKKEVPCFSVILLSTSVAEAGVDVVEMGEGNVAGIGDGAALFSGLEGSTVP